MSKITIVGLENEKAGIFDTLVKMGVVEIVDQVIESEEDSLLYTKKEFDKSKMSLLESDITKTSQALDSLNRHAPFKKGMFDWKRDMTFEEYRSLENKREGIIAVSEKIISLEEKLSSLKTEENRINNLIASLKPWESLNEHIEQGGTRNTVVYMGMIPANIKIDEFKDKFTEEIEEGVLIPVNSDREQHYIYCVVHISLEMKANELMKSNAFTKATFKDLTGTSSSNINLSNIRIKEIEEERKAIVEEIKVNSKSRPDFEALYDYLKIEQSKLLGTGGLIGTNKSFMLNGWIPKDASLALVKYLSDTFTCTVEVEEPKEDEEIPILLSNNAFADSVESITSMYSLPNRKEIDPNAIMAPFFVLFFGLMMSDAGYGLMLVIACGLMLLKVRMDPGKKRFIKLLFFCGLSTVFWGMLFGGLFGDFLALVTNNKLAIKPLWFNPVENPERMLQYALLFGIVHLYTGIAIRGINHIIRRKYIDAVLDTVVWYVFFTGFVLFVLPYVPQIPADKITGLVDLGGKLIIIGAILLILTQGRNKKGIFGKIFGGVSKLYDLVGFMSDVLSYSRLLALGLASSVVATIVNQMGASLGLDNFAGIIVFAIVFVGGHIFNFAINALGAYVHSSRLQYIEFFSKFYEGGGKAFKPLKINTKYINIKGIEQSYRT